VCVVRSSRQRGMAAQESGSRQDPVQKEGVKCRCLLIEGECCREDSSPPESAGTRGAPSACRGRQKCAAHGVRADTVPAEHARSKQACSIRLSAPPGSCSSAQAGRMRLYARLSVAAPPPSCLHKVCSVVLLCMCLSSEGRQRENERSRGAVIFYPPHRCP